MRSQAAESSDLKPLDIPSFIDARPVGAFQIMVVTLCALVMLLDGLDTQVIGYLGPALAKDWRLPATQLGPIFSSGLVGLMIGLLIIGPLADKIGRKPVIVLSVVLFGCFTLLSAKANNVTGLLIYRMLAGIGLGGAMPNALALTGEYCPCRRRATLVVIMFCGYSVGAIIGGVAAAALVTGFGWRSVFLLGGALPLLTAPVLFLSLPESLHFLVLKNKPAAGIARVLSRIDSRFRVKDAVSFEISEARPQGAPVIQLFRAQRGPGTILLWIAFFMNLLDLYFLQNWLPTIFTESGLTMQAAVLASTLIFAGGILAGILSGPLMDRFGPYRVLAGLFAFGAIAVASIGFAPPSLPAVLGTTFCSGLAVSGGQKSVNALAVIFYPSAIRSTGVGWALGIARMGSIAGPLVGGWLITMKWPVERILEFAALPMLCAGFAMFAMGLHYRAGEPWAVESKGLTS